MTKEQTKIPARHFSGVSPVNGVSLLALASSGGGSSLLKVRGKSIRVTCLDFSYTCLNKNFAQHWYAFQARTNQASGFPLRTGLNDLQVDHWVDQELVTKMAAEGFVVPELDPNAANAAQAEGGEGWGN
jgi:hypothetical protein